MYKRQVVGDVGRPVKGAIALIGDSQATRDVIVNPGSTARTRYFERATMIVKRLYMLDRIAPYLVATNYMIADIFTKALDPATFLYLRKHLLNIRDGSETYVTDYRGNTLTLRGKAARWWDKLVLTKH